MPVIKRIIIFVFFLIIEKNSFHLEKTDVVTIKRTAVQIVRCTVNSIGLAKDANLKYMTPIIPHHNDATNRIYNPF